MAVFFVFTGTQGSLYSQIAGIFKKKLNQTKYHLKTSMFNVTYSSDKRIFPKKQVIVLEIKTAVTQTQLHNMEKMPGCVRRGRYDVQKTKYDI